MRHTLVGSVANLLVVREQQLLIIVDEWRNQLSNFNFIHFGHFVVNLFDSLESRVQ